MCKYLIKAIKENKDCSNVKCSRHLLYTGLKLKKENVNKNKKYYLQRGCDSYFSNKWKVKEIAELWGVERKTIWRCEKKALKKFKKNLEHFQKSMI